ncbi:MAG: MBL fold metallo-hydrolase [Polyangiaceae bacterium]|nr:MBL fold metallo-hydrolase [Polyangiaceae bacterium]
MNRSLRIVALVSSLAALSLGPAGCASSPASDPASPGASPAAGPAETNEKATRAELRIGTYTSDQNGFDTQSHWIDTGKEVVVFDAQFTERHARELVDAIRKETSSPIRFLVITHPNPDKFNGASVFQSIGAKVVASRATADAIHGVHEYKRAFFVDMAKMIPADAYPKEPRVDIVFDHELELPTEAGRIVLRKLEHAGVSSTQTVGWAPEAHALFVGDLVHHGAHAWLEGGIVGGGPRPDLASWVAALDELSAIDEKATVYGGRGAPAPVTDAVPAQQAYLRKAESIVKAYIAELGKKKSELSGPKAPEHHAAIAKRFTEAFPDRTLGYLVQYGVYGLAGQLAKE